MLEAAAELDRDPKSRTTGRRAAIALLMLGGPRVSSAGALLGRDQDLANGRIEIGGDKTHAGVREIAPIAARDPDRAQGRQTPPAPTTRSSPPATATPATATICASASSARSWTVPNSSSPRVAASRSLPGRPYQLGLDTGFSAGLAAGMYAACTREGSRGTLDAHPSARPHDDLRTAQASRRPCRAFRTGSASVEPAKRPSNWP